MISIELARRDFDRSVGWQGKTSWPLAISEENLVELLAINGKKTFEINTRAKDQMTGVEIYFIKDLLMLVTLLKSWQRKKPWVQWLLQCFVLDTQLNQDWELRITKSVGHVPTLVLNEEMVVKGTLALPGSVKETLELTQLADPVDFVMLPGTLPSREVHRATLKELFHEEQACRVICFGDLEFPSLREEERKLMPNRHPLNFDDVEMETLVSNIGQEEPLW